MFGSKHWLWENLGGGYKAVADWCISLKSWVAHSCPCFVYLATNPAQEKTILNSSIVHFWLQNKGICYVRKRILEEEKKCGKCCNDTVNIFINIWIKQPLSNSTIDFLTFTKSYINGWNRVF